MSEENFHERLQELLRPHLGGQDISAVVVLATAKDGSFLRHSHGEGLIINGMLDFQKRWHWMQLAKRESKRQSTAGSRDE